MHCWFQSSLPLYRRSLYFENFVFSPHVRESKAVLDSGFFFSETWIPGFPMSSLSCIPESKVQDSISQAKITLIPESRFHHMGRRFGPEDTNFKLISRLEFGHICKAWILGSVLWSNVVNDRTKEPGRPPILVRLMGGLTVSN